MSGPDQQVPVCAVYEITPIPVDQRNSEIKAYNRNYFSMMVAMLLAKSRRETDGTEDITAAAAKCHISDQPLGPANQNNPFKF